MRRARRASRGRRSRCRSGRDARRPGSVAMARGHAVAAAVVGADLTGAGAGFPWVASDREPCECPLTHTFKCLSPLLAVTWDTPSGNIPLIPALEASYGNYSVIIDCSASLMPR